jgi:hypothetical protein
LPSARFEKEAPTGFASNCDGDTQLFPWQARFDPVGPFHHANTATLEVFVGPEVVKFRWPAQAVGVEMVDWQSALVFMDQNERRTAYRWAVNGHSFRYGPDKLRLAGTQWTNQGNHCAREQ